MSDEKRGFLGRLFGRKDNKTQTDARETVETADAPLSGADDAAQAPLAPEAPTEVEPKAQPAEARAPQTDSPDSETSDLATPETPVEPAPTAPADGERPTPAAEAPQQPAPEAAAEPAQESEPPAPMEPETSEAAPEPAAPRLSWFARLKAGLSRSSASLTGGITALFTKRKLDAETLEELEDLLIQADLGVETAMTITERISDGRFDKEIAPEEVRRILAEEVAKVLEPVAQPLVLDPANAPHVVLMVGVNGTGKTTTIGKLAAKLRAEGKSVMLAAGDTFRAAAVEQLKIWGERTGAPVVARDTGADAAGLVFDAMREAREKGVDVLLIDTAGRLQNRAELMAELEKVVRVIRKHDPNAPHSVLLTLDATTGQNAMNQVEIFGKTAGVTGLVMTKLDGTARGGILVAIAARHKLPVHFIGVGEGIDDLEPFTAGDFAAAIAASES
ncbi:signal recognition particle-docking protein FtsY [Stappia indica]|uniref:signal recognition particle-docking protein FtsY n=1 Tax=Stappia indica TaxID=538381 RepID=UPI001CD4D4BD|nr:signal recognition particle-docking protein FtsY [Stappia indica]MCA1300236.1 signal recognition particle-docking protein FtsY [Stappia indica]